MGLKSQRQKEARKELKRTLRASELCPHCRKKVQNLDEHIKTAHSISCSKCGQRFQDEQSWKHHMRDFHGLAESEAAKEDRHDKLSKWVQEKPSQGGWQLAKSEAWSHSPPLRPLRCFRGFDGGSQGTRTEQFPGDSGQD
eukprot:symbB.v1.2.014182.t1/scaffold1030.1/size143088/6